MQCYLYTHTKTHVYALLSMSKKCPSCSWTIFKNIHKGGHQGHEIKINIWTYIDLLTILKKIGHVGSH